MAEYFASLLAASLLVPIGLHWVITKHRMDRFGHPLASAVRFNDAPWYYLLTGADFAPDKLLDLIKISAIVDVAGEPYLLGGFAVPTILNRLDGLGHSMSHRGGR